MKKLIYTLLYLVMTIVLITSCEHKELCYKHPHTTKVRIDVDWSKFTKYETPTGMSLMFYPQYSVERAIGHLSNTTSHAIVNLAADRYHVLVFNQSTSEFGSISFRGLDKQETAEVVTNEFKSRWYTMRSKFEKVATNPEWLGVGNYSYADVTQDMIDAEVEATMNVMTKSGESVIALLKPLNVVHTANVKIHIKGIQNLRTARGSLNGMAEGYRLTLDEPTKSSVTHLMEEWTMKRDAADPTMGVIEGSFTSFGLPNGHQLTAEENLLTLSLLLMDNKTIKEYSFHVGDKFIRYKKKDNIEEEDEVQLHLYLELYPDIILPDVPAGGSTGGFDAIVDDWGDEEEYEVGV